MKQSKQSRVRKKLPFRKNVACVVFKENRFLLVQPKGWEKQHWKFPQGGIRKGETLESAAERELLEEVGIKNYRVVGESKNLNKYDWDEKNIVLAGNRWRGQIQHFLLIEFTGPDNEAQIQKKEIQAFKWVSRKQLFQHIAHDHQIFQGYLESIKKVLLEFGESLKPKKPPNKS